RGHLLEEARLDRHAVHEPAHRAGLAECVVAEDARTAAVREQERRQQADQRRLARAVRAEDRDAFAARDVEAHSAQRFDAAASLTPAVTPDELLAQIVNF